MSSMAKDDVTRQQERRAKMRAAGFSLYQVWVHPADWPLVRRYIDRLRKRRTDGSRGGRDE